MRISRKRLNLNSLAYSREYDVDRSTGIHLMQIVEWIGQTSGIEKRHSNSSSSPKINLEHLATPGFLWEHVMSREEKLERALSWEAMHMEMIHRKELLFPGEMFWCRQCDSFMTGGKHAIQHCHRTGHKGIYFTPDAYDFYDECYVEWKFSWKSSKRSHPKILNSAKGIWRWPVQCMFNCLGLETNTAKLIALHCNGEYKRGMPEAMPYEITLQFTDRELRRNKLMIVTNATKQGWI